MHLWLRLNQNKYPQLCKPLLKQNESNLSPTFRNQEGEGRKDGQLPPYLEKGRELLQQPWHLLSFPSWSDWYRRRVWSDDKKGSSLITSERVILPGGLSLKVDPSIHLGITPAHPPTLNSSPTRSRLGMDRGWAGACEHPVIYMISFPVWSHCQ